MCKIYLSRITNHQHILTPLAIIIRLNEQECQEYNKLPNYLSGITQSYNG